MSKLQLLVLVIILLFLTSCKKKPKPSLEYNEMVQLAIDLYIAEEISRDYPVAVRDSINKLLSESIQEIYQMSQEEIDSNLYLYETDHELYEKLLQDMKTRLDSIPLNNKSK